MDSILIIQELHYFSFDGIFQDANFFLQVEWVTKLSKAIFSARKKTCNMIAGSQ